VVKRILSISEASSFFIFGARGTGKSTLLRSLPFLKNALTIDLLKPRVEDQYRLDPSLLEKEVSALKPDSWVVVDEVQKLPRLLDSVHSLIEEKKVKFALSGSSARKLKRGASNLLAGRAFTYHLFPLTSSELKGQFDLHEALSWGTLPGLLKFKKNEDRFEFLQSYIHTYIKEEIQIEQLVRNLDPFRLFLPIAAQMNAQPINYSNIAEDTGVSYKTIESYFQILEDTLLGHFLLPYGKSVRKVQRQSPKFYFVDNGIKRALENKLTIPLTPQNSEFGNSFETWFINECISRNHYLRKNLSFSYLRTKDDVEVDLIIEEPRGHSILVEIKSTEKIKDDQIQSLHLFQKDFPKSELICACRVPREQKNGRIWILPWEKAFRVINLA